MIIVNKAQPQTSHIQRPFIGRNATINTRKKTANAAAFGPADINALTGAAAPWYTSGAQTWNGTTDTLNPKPTKRSAAASPATKADAEPWSRALRICTRFVVPVSP